ncbi:MAG: UvrD-helicase domain-containing protein, partial [Mariprofundaceae bacterium]
MSAKARLKARHPAHSFLVQAPAGSGKTELLTQRILALLATVDEPEEILALTFTRKAAAEMRNRVIEALGSRKPDGKPDQGDSHKMMTWKLARKAIQRSDEKGWNLMRHPARLRIMTLDSLAYTLARQLPLLSGLGEVPGPSEYVELIYREAAEAAIDEAMRDFPDEAEHVLLHQDHNAVSVIGMLADMLGKREQWLKEIATHGRDMDALYLMLENNLDVIMTQKLARCDALVPMRLRNELPALMNFAGINRGDEVLSSISGWPDVSLDGLGTWKLIADFLLTARAPLFRKPGGVNMKLGFPTGKENAPAKERIMGLLDMLSDQPELAGSLHELRMLPDDTAMDDGQWQVLESLFLLLVLANKQLRLLFGQRGESDFTEIALRAMDALGNSDVAPGELLMKLDYQINHILVDEFQDTSLLQMHLLQRLTTGWQCGDGRHRSLFMVGDPMQSIYRFRKAEVGFFLNAAQNEADLPVVEALQLKRNFRSAPAIVDWANMAFQSIFPDRQDVISGTVAYTPATAALSHEGAVNLHLQHGMNPESEAETVVGLVKRELESASYNGAKQRIGILARSRKHLHSIMSSLAVADIPFRAINILPLDSQPEVRLLHALLSALLHPIDRKSWAAILRAPCCGLTSRDMYTLMAVDERPLWQIIRDEKAVRRLSPDARERVIFVRKALEPCMAISGAVSVRDLLETAWQRLLMPSLTDATSSLNVSTTLELIGLLEEGGRIDFALLDGRLKKLYAAPDASDAAARVELLTMHGAKGLQWDVVILPGLGYGSAKSDTPLLAFSEVPVEGGA